MRLLPKRFLETVLLMAITSLPLYAIRETAWEWWDLNTCVLIALAFALANLALTVFFLQKNVVQSTRFFEYLVPNLIVIGTMMLISYLLPESVFWYAFSFLRIAVMLHCPRLIALSAYWGIVLAVFVYFAIERCALFAEMQHRGIIGADSEEDEELFGEENPFLENKP